jgi:hypothetical protein
VQAWLAGWLHTWQPALLGRGSRVQLGLGPVLTSQRRSSFDISHNAVLLSDRASCNHFNINLVDLIHYHFNIFLKKIIILNLSDRCNSSLIS